MEDQTISESPGHQRNHPTPTPGPRPPTPGEAPLLYCFDSLSSTNDLAREMAARGADEGTVIVAREQTSGRGRNGRTWASPKGQGLYLSLILRPQLTPARSAVITLAAAVAVAETLSLDYGVAVDIKWPNDVLAGSRKISGILVESAIEKDRLLYAVLGIGVNLGQTEFPEDIGQTATSLLIESGLLVTPDDFLGCLLERIKTWYAAALDKPSEVIAGWESLSSYASDRAVRIVSPDEVIEGITRGLAASGALRIELVNGDIREVVSGEVSLRARS